MFLSLESKQIVGLNDVVGEIRFLLVGLSGVPHFLSARVMEEVHLGKGVLNSN